MAGYSSDEINSAVSGLVQSSITVKRDALGPVDQDAKFDEVVKLISSTLIFDPNSIFYLLFLITNKLNAKVLSAIKIVEDLQEAIQEIGRVSTPISGASLLGDAAAALTEVDAVLSSDSSIKQSAFDRYSSNVDAFSNTFLRPNIVSAGALVRPPQQAITDAAVDLDDLRASYPDLLEKASNLANFVDKFMSLGLPSLSAKNSVRQTRLDLEAVQEVFDDPDTTDDAKIAQARDAYLRLAAGKSVLSTIRTVSDPRNPRIDARTGTGLYGRAALPITPGKFLPATVACTVSGPWKLPAGNILTIAEDGNTATDYPLYSIGFPTVGSSGTSTSYDLHDISTAVLVSSISDSFDVPASPDNVLTLIVNGVVYSGAITPGTISTDQLVTDVSAVAGLTSVLEVTNASGHLQLETIGLGSQYGIIIRTMSAILGFSGTNAYATGKDNNRNLYIDGHSVSLAAGTRTPEQIAADIVLWAEGESLPYTSVADIDGMSLHISRTDGYSAISLNAPEVGSSDRDDALRTYETLGFFDTQSNNTTDVSATAVAELISGVGKLTASVESSVLASGADGHVVDITHFQVSSSGVPDATLLRKNMLYIKSGPSAGYHRIESTQASTPYLILEVNSLTPLSISESTTENWEVVHEIVRLTSKNTTMATSVRIVGGSAATLLGFDVGITHGLTTGLQILAGTTVQNLKISDVVAGDKALFDGVPDSTRTVVALSSPTQVELDIPLSTDVTVSYSLEIDSIDVIEYRQLLEDLSQWQNYRSENPYVLLHDDTAELERVMNPLLYGNTKSVSYLNTAYAIASLLHSSDGAGILDKLSDLLVEFVVRVVDRIESSLRMLQERGFDAAYDTLMDGDIVGFYGMDKYDASTSAAVMKASRAVVQNDVPVSKTDEDVDDISHDPAPVITTDADYDHSDADLADAPLIEQDATLDADESSGSTTKGRSLSG